MRGICGLVVARPESVFGYGCEIGVGLGVRRQDLGTQAVVSVSFPVIEIAGCRATVSSYLYRFDE